MNRVKAPSSLTRQAARLATWGVLALYVVIFNCPAQPGSISLGTANDLGWVTFTIQNAAVGSNVLRWAVNPTGPQPGQVLTVQAFNPATRTIDLTWSNAPASPIAATVAPPPVIPPPVVVVPPPAVCASSQTLATSYDRNSVLGNSYGSAQIAAHITPGITIKVCKVGVRLCKNNSPTGTISLKLYTGGPGNLLQASSTILDAGTLTDSAATYYFDFPGTQQLLAGTPYAIVLHMSNPHGAHFINVQSKNTGNYYVSPNGAAWSLMGPGTFWTELWGQ